MAHIPSATARHTNHKLQTDHRISPIRIVIGVIIFIVMAATAWTIREQTGDTQALMPSTAQLNQSTGQ